MKLLNTEFPLVILRLLTGLKELKLSTELILSSLVSKLSIILLLLLKSIR
jgi:hypothetical protein